MLTAAKDEPSDTLPTEELSRVASRSQDAEASKIADLSLPKTAEFPETATDSSPLKTIGLSNDPNTQSSLNTSRALDKPSWSGPGRLSISGESPSWPKKPRAPSVSLPPTTGNASIPDRGSPLNLANSIKSEDKPASPRKVDSRRTSDIRSLLKAVDVGNNADVSSSSKTIESPDKSYFPPAPSSSKDIDVSSRRSLDPKVDPETFYAADDEGIDSPDILPSSPSSGLSKDKNARSQQSFRQTADSKNLDVATEEIETPKEQPEPATPNVLVEIPQTTGKGQKLPIPKIFVERASDTAEVQDSWSATKLPTIDKERKGTGSAQVSARVQSQGGSIQVYPPVSALRGPGLPQIPENAEVPEQPKPLKRKLYLRKARNLAARNTLLKAALGRQLAGVTKPALRRLANGESFGIEASEQGQVQVQVKVIQST